MEIAFPPVAYSCALEFIGQALVDRNRPVNAFDDLAQTDFGRGPVELISACHAFLGFRDAGLGQLAQDLKREAQRDAGLLGNILGTLLSPGERQAVGHTNCIVCLMCDSQFVPSFL